ncbi:MAG TPA: hypothetical protein PKC25_04470, partial [Candidatus Rifleibacterium sp.]|nr:hypothetical protein [Candidatus Rifleibacterium sp.]
MRTRDTQKSLLIPYLWILLILAFPVLIINAGTGSQQKDQMILHEADEAGQLLDSLVNGANESVFLANLARSLTKSLKKTVSETARQDFNPHRHFLRPDFPEHEIWVFTNETLFYPDRVTTSRRAMYRLFQALKHNDFSDGQNKLADFLFGPGLKIRHLALKKARPIRVLYQKRYCQMIWNSFTTETGRECGFFLIVHESDKLKRYVMEFSSRAITRSDQDTHNGKTWWRGGGYLRIFPDANPSVLPKFAISDSELQQFLNDWCRSAQFSRLERTNLPWAFRAGKWKLFSRVIPDSAHLAIVVLPDTPSSSETSRLLVLINSLYAVFTAGLLFCFLFDKKLPAMSLKTRFSFIFLALAAVPFSLFFIAFNTFAGEHEASLLREARQKLENAVARYDESIGEIYQNLRVQLLKLENAEWFKKAILQKNPVSQNLALMTGKLLESFSPGLPWGAITFSDPEGNVATPFKSEMHRATLEGYARFNRVGIIEAM